MLQHFFDGLGLLHKFRMTNGEVHYTSRYTAEGVVRNAKKNGYMSGATMFGLNANTPLKHAQDPCSALLGAQVITRVLGLLVRGVWSRVSLSLSL